MDTLTAERRACCHPTGDAPPIDALSRLAGLRGMVGRTPLLVITLRWRGALRRVYAKAEFLNLTGSIKDRMALHVLHTAAQAGQLKPGDTLAEATSGNAGISITAIGRALGHPVVIYMPDWMSTERIALMRSFGADVRLVSKAEGGFLGSIRMTEELAASRSDVFLPRQFANEANVQAHFNTTGPELIEQLAELGLVPSAFVAGVGTGGTVMGVGAALKARFPKAGAHPLEPLESPTLSTGSKVGHHRIQGVSDEFIPPICRLDELDDIVGVHDGDAILMAQLLARQFGLGVGISSGANLLGALKLQERLGPEAVVATVFSDDSKKYLSTDLVRDEPVRAGYLTPEVELVGWDTLRCR